MRACVAVVVLVGLIGVGSARADEKPAAGKGYELRIVSHGDTYNGIRFKPTTGESWKILNGRFEKLEEAAAPPAGDYDIVIIPAEILLAVRIDRSTGSCWLLTKDKWNPVKEPPAKPGAAAAKAPGAGCELRHIIVGEQLHVVRFHTKTGESWHLSGDTFSPMGEFGKVPAGDFDLTMSASKKNWTAFRLDRKSGKLWLYRANIWTEIVEPAPKPGAAPAEPPGPDCALRHIVVGDHFHVVRFHTKTGETWHVTVDTFSPMGEFGKVPAGDFDLTMIASEKDWMAFRLDRKSGKSWLLQANIWTEITQPE